MASDCAERIAQILGAAFGLPDSGGPFPDMRQPPFIQLVETDVATELTTDADPARENWVRGHVANVGADPCRVSFRTASGQTGWYELPPSAALEIAWYTRAVLIDPAGAPPARVQVLFQ